MPWFSKDEPKVAKPQGAPPKVQKEPYFGFAFKQAAKALKDRPNRIDAAVDEAVMGKKRNY